MDAENVWQDKSVSGEEGTGACLRVLLHISPLVFQVSKVMLITGPVRLAARVVYKPTVVHVAVDEYM